MTAQDIILIYTLGSHVRALRILRLKGFNLFQIKSPFCKRTFSKIILTKNSLVRQDVFLVGAKGFEPLTLSV